MNKISSIGVHIKVKDFKKSLAFYTALGFKKVFEYGPRKKIKEAYDGAVFEQGSTKLEIADGHRAVKLSVFREKVKSSKISLMISVKSISALIAACTRNKISIAVKPRHYYWGTLEVVVKDPDGVVLVFISPYSKKEAKKIHADESFAGNPNK